MQTLWKIRQKKSGLFWNGNRWANLEGAFNEKNAVSLDEEREMVQLIPAPAAPTKDFEFRWDSYYDTGVATKGQQVIRHSHHVPIDALPQGLHPNWPHLYTHPNTGEPFSDGKIGYEKNEQRIFGADGGWMNTVVGGVGMLRGKFTCDSGSSVEGYLDGGSWRWTEVKTTNRRP